MKRELTVDIPFLPTVGQLFMVSTIIFQPADKKPRRPMVVVGAPSDLRGRVAVVVRTSDTEADGIAHRADLSLGCNKDGVFTRLKTTEAQLWTPRNVRLLGHLPVSLLRDVVERWYE